MFFSIRSLVFLGRLVLLWLFLGGVVFAQAKPGDGTALRLRRRASPRHPFLLVTSARIAQLRKAIQANSWQAQNWLRLQEQADKLLAETVELPPRAGNWDQYYVDTISGVGLQRGQQVGDWQWEHRNPQTGQLFRSQPNKPSQDYDGVVLGLIHNAWALGVVQLGLAYQLSQEARYARKAREILLAYADLYPRLPVTNRSRGRNPKDTDFGKAHVQTLDEAIWLLNLVQGADLIWPMLTKQEQQQLQEQLFLPAAHLVTQPNQLTPNIVCWENAAIGSVGLLTENKQLIELALTDSAQSFSYQVRSNITADGFWVERAPGYQFYALHALITLGQAAVNAGYPIDLSPLKKMVDAPLQLASPDLALPAFNDSHTPYLWQEDYLYEWAYAQFHDPRYSLALRPQSRGKTGSGGPLFLDWALLYGEQTLPPIKPYAAQSVNFPATGYGLLAKGSGRNSTLLYLKYTPYVNGHSHREQLSFVLMKGSELIAVDPGVNSYGDPTQWLWYKTTAAHNTFLIDKNLQRASLAQCLAFGQSAGADYLMMETRTAYDSVRFVRTAVALTENLVLFVDQSQVRRHAKHLDIAYHQVGHWLNLPPTDPFRKPLGGGGFRLLENLRVAHQQCGTSLLGQLPSGRQVRVSTDALVPTEVITASDPVRVNGEVSSVFFQRPVALNGLLVWCIALDGQPIAIEVEELPLSAPAGRQVPALRLKLRTPQGQQWEVLVNPDQQPLRADLKGETTRFRVEERVEETK
jgi:hypothetical protein